MQFLESEWWPNDLEGQVQWPPFSIIAERIPNCIFGDSSPNPSRRQAEFPTILSQNDQKDLESQGQWPPFSIPAETIPGRMFGANFVILAQIYDKLLRGQSEFPKILSQNDFVGQGQWPPFSLPAESIPGRMFGANFAIPAQTCDE